MSKCLAVKSNKVSNKAYILLHPGQLLVQPASVRASRDRKGAHGLRWGAALTSGLIDQLLCGVQDLQHLCSDAAEWGCCVFLIQKNTSASSMGSATSHTLMWKKLLNAVCLANGTMQTEGKCILVCASIAVMQLMNKLKRGYDVPGFLARKQTKTLKGESTRNTLACPWLTKGWSHSSMHESQISDFTGKKERNSFQVTGRVLRRWYERYQGFGVGVQDIDLAETRFRSGEAKCLLWTKEKKK